MLKVSSAEVQKNFGRYQDLALTEPVVVTRNGRERIVILSSQEYHRLKRRDREVLGIADFTAADIAAIEQGVGAPESAAFDHEIG